jgi:hypothetical protein
MESIGDYHMLFGGPQISYSATDHQGMHGAILVRVENGHWTQIGKPLTN